MRQAGILAAAGIYALDNMVERLAEDHLNAKILGNELKTISGIKIDPDKISTNLIFFHLENANLLDENFINQLLRNKINSDYKGNHKFRMVTHYGFEKNDITKVILAFKEIFNNKGN